MREQLRIPSLQTWGRFRPGPRLPVTVQNLFSIMFTWGKSFSYLRFRLGVVLAQNVLTPLGFWNYY